MDVDGRTTDHDRDRPLTAPAPGRARTVTLWVVQVLLALMFLFTAAIPELAGERTGVEIFTEIGIGQWFRYLVGMLELAGGIGLLIPRLSGPAALGLVGVMVGATFTQLFILDSVLLAITPAVVGVLLAFVAWTRRAQIAALLRGRRGRGARPSTWSRPPVS
jgi:putative oxidoreductase